jgi:hydroxymethylpyrimidine kinase/phosphomethylpyrimidine kinase
MILEKLLGIDGTGPQMRRRAAAACSISAHDPLGARFLAADARTFAAVGVHPVLVACGVRARGPQAGAWAIPGQAVDAQLAAAWATAPPDAVKVGAVETLDAVTLVRGAFGDAPPAAVLDPEIIDKKGARIASDEVAEALRTEILPLSSVVVLNIYEAALWSDLAVRGDESLRQAMRAVYDQGVGFVVGHNAPDERHAVDWVFDGSGFIEFGSDRVDSPFVAGSGAVFSAALTAYLARGAKMLAAIESAKELATEAVRGGAAVAWGMGPANPLSALYDRAGINYAAIEELVPE